MFSAINICVWIYKCSNSTRISIAENIKPIVDFSMERNIWNRAYIYSREQNQYICIYKCIIFLGILIYARGFKNKKRLSWTPDNNLVKVSLKKDNLEFLFINSFLWSMFCLEILFRSFTLIFSHISSYQSLLLHSSIFLDAF